MKLKIESYKYETQERSWGACQENDQDSYYTVGKTGWRIVNERGVVIETFYSEEEAKRAMGPWQLNRSQIKARTKQMRKNRKAELRKLEDQHIKECSEWETKALRRNALLSSGKTLSSNLVNLNYIFKSLDEK